MESASPVDVGTFFSERGFGGSMGLGSRPCLLVVDMQVGFTDPTMPLGADQDAQVAVIAGLQAVFRDLDLPVVFLGVSYEEPGCADAGIWRLKNAGVATLAAGTRAVELDPRLDRRPDEPLVYRRYPSGFFGTDLATRLTVRGVDTVVTVGCTTSGCIRATVVDAMQYGFRPVVVAEGVADRSERAHEQSLFDIQAKYGDVVTDAELREVLRSRRESEMEAT